MVLPSSPSSVVACVVGACAGMVVLACVDEDHVAVDHEAGTVRATVSEPSTDAGETLPPPSSPPGEESCEAAAATCTVFEPGGPERWGCWSTGTVPELACEHAAGATIARCNCSGAFGERPPGTPPAYDVDWFDVAATSTPFTQDEVLRLWKTCCHGRCVSPEPRALGPDAG